MPLVPEQRSRGTLPFFIPESSSFSSPARNKPTYFASSVILLESVGSWGKMITLRCVSLDFATMLVCCWSLSTCRASPACWLGVRRDWRMARVKTLPG
jgi:hypothetical protein